MTDEPISQVLQMRRSRVSQNRLGKGCCGSRPWMTSLWSVICYMWMMNWLASSKPQTCLLIHMRHKAQSLSQPQQCQVRLQLCVVSLLMKVGNALCHAVLCCAALRCDAWCHGDISLALLCAASDDTPPQRFCPLAILSITSLLT